MAASTVEGPVAHHFNNMGQQLATVRFGMWLFLITEVLFFGGAFCAYTAYRVWYPRDFEAGSAALNVSPKAISTLSIVPAPAGPVRFRERVARIRHRRAHYAS